MAQSYSAQRIFDSHRESDIRVTSARCLYTIWSNQDECMLIGPGVQETTTLEGLPTFDSDEDRAIYLVLLFENGLWPDD